MIGRLHVHHRLIDSTNEWAKRIADEGGPHGAIVTADEQSAGRGRQGRTWTAAPGEALLLSLIVRNLEPRHSLLPLMAAVAVCEAAEKVARVPCSIKWPNDVWIDGLKLSGILIEARPAADWAIVGVGLNTGVREFPPELQDSATTLSLDRPGQALPPLLAALDHWISAGSEAVLAAWRERDALAGSAVGWGDGRSGIARGIDDSGALLVETADRAVIALDAGEVHLRR